MGLTNLPVKLKWGASRSWWVPGIRLNTSDFGAIIFTPETSTLANHLTFNLPGAWNADMLIEVEQVSYDHEGCVQRPSRQLPHMLRKDKHRAPSCWQLTATARQPGTPGSGFLLYGKSQAIIWLGFQYRAKPIHNW